MIKCTATAHLPQQETSQIKSIFNDCLCDNQQSSTDYCISCIKIYVITQTHLISLFLYKGIRDITEVDLLLLNKVLALPYLF